MSTKRGHPRNAPAKLRVRHQIAEIAHGRLTHDAREPVGKCGAGDPDLGRKPIYAPVVLSTRVQQGERPADHGVAEPGKPSTLRRRHRVYVAASMNRHSAS
jgi:hypothetical protein